jgi:hypothetical protein
MLQVTSYWSPLHKLQVTDDVHFTSYMVLMSTSQVSKYWCPFYKLQVTNVDFKSYKLLLTILQVTSYWWCPFYKCCKQCSGSIRGRFGRLGNTLDWFHWLFLVRLLARRVTGWVCEKNVQNVIQPIFFCWKT